MTPILDRLPPPDWEHLSKYPLTASTAPSKPSPMVIGVNWYSAFDAPRKDSSGRWWVARDGNLGSVRGGHCVALKAKGASDPTTWWDYYDQGSEGRCVQFGVSRMMSHLNRRQYEVREGDAEGRWLYYEAQKIDAWPGGSYPGADPVYEGTSVRAGLQIVRQHGIIRKGASSPSHADGISAYRWARSVDDALDVLGYTGLDYVDVMNSWGRTGYPHLVRMPASVLERLRQEDGEVGVVTDR